MIELIFKTIACSGLFIGFYLLILQREKMFAFNRFYLLATLCLAFAIPFMELGIDQMLGTPEITEIIPVEITQNHLNFTIEKSIEANAISAENISSGFNWWTLIPGIYLIITLTLLLRFISNILNLWLIIRFNERINKEGFTIISVKSKISTFSFFNYLFVSKNEMKSGRIQPEIFRHELAHMKQKHSFDVVLIELLKVFFWFNPFLYIYKKSIQTNHEFLADAEVLNQTEDAVHYQQLLLEKISAKPQTALSSPFNYLVTKKRFIMMTKKTSKIKTIALKLFSIPLLVLTMLVFSEKVSAQIEPGKGVSKELFREYKKQVRKATVKVKNADGTKTKQINTENLDTKLLTNIYDKMSNEQKLKVTPIPNSKNTDVNDTDWKFALSDLDFIMSDLDFLKSDINFEISDLGFDLSDLNFSIADLVVDVNSPEFKEKIAEIEKNAAEIEAKYNSPEFKKKIAEIERNAAEIEAKYNSPEFKKKIAEIERNAAEIEAKYNSPEFKKKIADIEKKAEEVEKYYDSPEFKKKIENIERRAAEIEKYYDSPEFKNKIKEIERKAEEMGKEAEKKAKKIKENA